MNLLRLLPVILSLLLLGAHFSREPPWSWPCNGRRRGCPGFGRL